MTKVLFLLGIILGILVVILIASPEMRPAMPAVGGGAAIGLILFYLVMCFVYLGEYRDQYNHWWFIFLPWKQ